MPQKHEDRIRAQYKSHRRHSHVYEWGVSTLWMSLARHWQLPVQEIKRIVKGTCDCGRWRGHPEPCASPSVKCG